MLTLGQVVAGLCLTAVSVYLNACCFVSVPPKFYFVRICIVPFMTRRKLLGTGRYFIFPFLFTLQRYHGKDIYVQIPESAEACPERTTTDRVVHLKSDKRVVVDLAFRYVIKPHSFALAISARLNRSGFWARTFGTDEWNGDYDAEADDVVDDMITEIAASTDDGPAFRTALTTASRTSRNGITIKFHNIVASRVGGSA